MIYKQAEAFYRGSFPKENLVYIEPETVIDVTQYNDSKNLTLSQFEHSSQLERFISKSSFYEVASVSTKDTICLKQLTDEEYSYSFDLCSVWNIGRSVALALAEAGQ